MQNLFSHTAEPIKLDTTFLQPINDWEDIFNSISDVITIQDNNFNITYANKAAKRVFKINSQIPERLKCYECYHGTSHPPERCPSCLCLKTGLPAAVEMFEPHLKRHIEIRALPRINHNHQFIGFIHIVRDITQRKESEEQLRKSQKELHDLTAYLHSARETERKHIAREIHDELAQALTALKMDLFWLNKKMSASQSELCKKTESMLSLVESTTKSVQRILSDLRPALLDDFGLEATMEWQAQDFFRRTGILCELTLDTGNIHLDNDRATAIFRIFQETLTNVVRHAGATSVQAILKKKAGSLSLVVHDDGKGITKNQVINHKSFGLIGMRERVHAWGGKFDIKGVRHKGTTLTVTIPTV